MKKTYLSGLAIALATSSGPFVFGQNYANPNPGLYGQQPPAYNPYQMANYPYRNQGASLLQDNGHEHVPVPNQGQVPMGANAIPQDYSNNYVPQPTPMAAPMAGPMTAPAPQPAPMVQGNPGCSSCGGNGGGMGGYGSYPAYGLAGGDGMAYGGAGGYDAGSCGGGYANGYGIAPGYSMGYAPLGGGLGAYGGQWFGGAGAVFFQQQDTRYIRLAFDSNMPTDSVLSSKSARIGVGSGVSAFVGRYFNCGRNAFAGSYWGMFPNRKMATYVAGAGENLRSSLPFTVLGPSGDPSSRYGLILPSQNVYDAYDGAVSHRVVRESEIHNAEISIMGFGLGGAAVIPGFGAGAFGSGFAGAGFGMAAGGFGGGGFGGGGFGGGGFGGCGDDAGYGVGGSCGSGACGSGACGGGGGCGVPVCGSSCGGGGGCGVPGLALAPACSSRLRLGWLGGVRWLRINDRFEYAASQTDNIYGATTDDMYYRNYVTNDLVGFQLGGFASYCATRSIALYTGTKFGVYGNHMQYRTFAGYEGIPATVASGNAFNGVPYDMRSSDTGVAFVGEGDIGLVYRIGCRWSANFGYRAVGVSGIATGTGQVPQRFDDVNEVLRLNNTQSMLLHGFYLGGNYNF